MTKRINKRAEASYGIQIQLNAKHIIISLELIATHVVRLFYLHDSEMSTCRGRKVSHTLLYMRLAVRCRQLSSLRELSEGRVSVERQSER